MPSGIQKEMTWKRFHLSQSRMLWSGLEVMTVCWNSRLSQPSHTIPGEGEERAGREAGVTPSDGEDSW